MFKKITIIFVLFAFVDMIAPPKTQVPPTHVDSGNLNSANMIPSAVPNEPISDIVESIASSNVNHVETPTAGAAHSRVSSIGSDRVDSGENTNNAAGTRPTLVANAAIKQQNTTPKAGATHIRVSSVVDSGENLLNAAIQQQNTTPKADATNIRVSSSIESSRVHSRVDSDENIVELSPTNNAAGNSPTLVASNVIVQGTGTLSQNETIPSPLNVVSSIAALSPKNNKASEDSNAVGSKQKEDEKLSITNNEAEILISLLQQKRADNKQDEKLSITNNEAEMLISLLEQKLADNKQYEKSKNTQADRAKRQEQISQRAQLAADNKLVESAASTPCVAGNCECCGWACFYSSSCFNCKCCKCCK